ncbi:MAG: DUF2271 domain-containing protein, partial [bacterium]|nr:DUF2271 domain-containing protein [bacterium]
MRILHWQTLLFFGLCIVVTALNAATDATVAFRVSTQSTGLNYDPKNIVAIWVMDSAGGFVKTLKKRGNTRQQYLYRWLADSGGNVVDAVTGATLPTQQMHNVTWNSRNTAGTVVADGTYYVRVEYTTSNGQGPYSTNWCQIVKGTANYTTNFPNLNGRFTNLQLTYTVVSHDIGVLAIAPAWAPPDATVPVKVLITNKVSVAETFVVTLSNATLNTFIGRRTIATLAGRAATNVVMNWSTAGLILGTYSLSASAGPVAGEAALYDNTLNADVLIRPVRYDLLVSAVTAARIAAPGITVPVAVTVSNQSDSGYGCTVTLRNATDNLVVGSQSIALLPSGTDAIVPFNWNTTGLAPGYRTLLAAVSGVTNETDLANNTNTVVIAVASGTLTTSVVLAQSAWRYHDQGFDLSAAPWQRVSYFDGAWKSGAGPLGYGGIGETTVLDFGADPNNKYPTYYFRRGFNLAVLPLSLRLQLRRDDGVVGYVNGVEVVRDNMPAGPIAYDTLASGDVLGADETNYFSIDLDTAALVAPGYNMLAFELHQAGANSPDLGFDAELIAELPDVPPYHDVNLHAFSASGPVQSGDKVHLRLTTENKGTVVESFAITVKDAATATPRALAHVANLAPNAARDLELTADTRGLAAGATILEAVAGPVDGETNLADNLASTVLAVIGADVAGHTTSVAGALGGYCAAVAVDGTTVFAGEGAELRAYDVSVPGLPHLLGRVQLPGVIRAMAVANNHVYAACGAAGLCVVSSTNTAELNILATLDTSGDACALATAGTMLYLADSIAGVRCIDISTPAQPLVLGVYHAKGFAQALALAGTMLYVLDANNGLDVVNISDPAAPALVGTCELVAMGRALARNGTTLYAVDGAGYLSIIDTATPNLPTVLGKVALPSPGRDIAMVGSVAYVATENAGLAIVDVSSPGDLAATNLYNATPDAAAIAVAGSMAYVAAGFGGLECLSLAAPSAPVLVGAVRAVTRARVGAIAGGILYSAAGNEGVRVYSLTNSAAPVFLGAYTNALNACDVVVVSQQLYVADGQYGLKIADTTAPDAPLHRSSYNNAALRALRLVRVQNGLAFISDGFRCELVDVTDPAAPVLRAAFATNMFIHDAVMTASNVYLAAGANGLLVLSYSPAGPLALAQQYATPGRMARGIALLGTRIYVADNEGGWLIVDRSQPAIPTLMTNRTLHAAVIDVAVAGNRLHLLDSAGGVHSLDSVLRLTPVERRVLEPLAQALRACAAGRYTLVAQDGAGAALLDTSPDDTDLDGLLDSFEFAIINANPGDGYATLADVHPEDDFDGDRMSNYAEMIAGTDPANPFSVFMVQRTDAGPDAPFVLQWSSVSNKTYTVHISTQPASGFSTLLSGIAATPPINVLTDVVTRAQSY